MAELETEIPKVKLNDGFEMPMLAYGTGTAMHKGGDQSTLDQEKVSQIETGIKLGYRHLDCAESYGTEPEVGAAIKASGVPRDEFFVTTKVSKNVQDIPKAIDDSLARLKLDYVDLYLIHNPFWTESKEDLQSAWAAMEAVRASGKARSIGVSNFIRPHLEAILAKAKAPPTINQIEFHPYLQHVDLVDWCKAQGIALTAYSVQTPVTKAQGGPCDALLASLSKKYAVGEGEILLRWCIDRGVTPITTSGSEMRMSDYMRSLAIKLTPREVKDISETGSQKHFRGFYTSNFAADDRS